MVILSAVEDKNSLMNFYFQDLRQEVYRKTKGTIFPFKYIRIDQLKKIIEENIGIKMEVSEMIIKMIFCKK